MLQNISKYIVVRHLTKMLSTTMVLICGICVLPLRDFRAAVLRIVFAVWQTKSTETK